MAGPDSLIFQETHEYPGGQEMKYFFQNLNFYSGGNAGHLRQVLIFVVPGIIVDQGSQQLVVQELHLTGNTFLFKVETWNIYTFVCVCVFTVYMYITQGRTQKYDQEGLIFFLLRDTSALIGPKTPLKPQILNLTYPGWGVGPEALLPPVLIVRL